MPSTNKKEGPKPFLFQCQSPAGGLSAQHLPAQSRSEGEQPSAQDGECCRFRNGLKGGRGIKDRSIAGATIAASRIDRDAYIVIGTADIFVRSQVRVQKNAGQIDAADIRANGSSSGKDPAGQELCAKDERRVNVMGGDAAEYLNLSSSAEGIREGTTTCRAAGFSAAHQGHVATRYCAVPAADKQAVRQIRNQRAHAAVAGSNGQIIPYTGVEVQGSLATESGTDEVQGSSRGGDNYRQAHRQNGTQY